MSDYDNDEKPRRKGSDRVTISDVRETLLNCGPKTVTELATILGIDRSGTDRKIQRLLKTGQVRVAGYDNLVNVSARLYEWID